MGLCGRFESLGSTRLARDDWEDASSRRCPERTSERNNDVMVVLAVILLVLVAVLVVAIVVSNPETYDLSIFGAVIPVNSAGVFITGAVAMAVTILALLLLRSGIRRARVRRKQLKALEASDGGATATSTSPAETPATTKTSNTSPTSGTAAVEPQTTKEKAALDLEGKSSTTPAERQAILDEADDLTRDEPQK
jgi:flagellar biosynthesis/type III secretory pathway M-ring protein FliF/YscJ